jgi:hypothetical protein
MNHEYAGLTLADVTFPSSDTIYALESHRSPFTGNNYDEDLQTSKDLVVGIVIKTHLAPVGKECYDTLNLFLSILYVVSVTCL